MNKVYIVVGSVYGEDDCVVVVSNHSVHSTAKRARQELYRVLEETVEEAKTNDIEFKSTMGEESLTIEWVETGAVEYWNIYEREIDKEVE